MKKLLCLALAASLILTSCDITGDRIKGNGNIKTESRQLGQFNSIDASGMADIYVKQDSVFSVRVETDENLLPYILIENKNGMLYIHQKSHTNLKPTKSIKVYVSGPSFSRFEASGACDFYTENLLTNNESFSFGLSGASDVRMELKAPRIEAGLSGAGTLILKGETKDFRIQGSGSTDIKCFEMMAENTTVKVSGAGDAEVFASVKLDVQVSGAADVKYKGNATVNQHISGAGSVTKVN